MRRHLLSLLALLLVLPLAAAPARAQDWAKAQLEKSPRHREWATIKRGDRTLQVYMVYPEVKTKVPVVILIHEIFGLSDWAKEMADEIAAAGYIVVAPDLLSGYGPKGGGSSEFPSQEATVKAISTLTPEGVNADLDAVADFVKNIAAGDGKVATVGFCWGGGKSFLFATHRPDLSAAFVFYGPPPPDADMKNIAAPVYGFYAGNDARIGATVPATIEAMKAAGKKYEPVTYDGAGHGFMRAGEDPGNTVPANKTAREQAFARLTTLLKQLNASTVPNTAPSSSLAIKLAPSKPTSEVICHDPSMQPPQQTPQRTGSM